ncbi:MAG: hypothetical protein L0H93_02365 [Nocardioides sp.]|nr:hypothetical protein [Nocardioides sp.]
MVQGIFSPPSAFKAMKADVVEGSSLAWLRGSGDCPVPAPLGKLLPRVVGGLGGMVAGMPLRPVLGVAAATGIALLARLLHTVADLSVTAVLWG